MVGQPASVGLEIFLVIKIRGSLNKTHLLQQMVTIFCALH
jgi:hypothetical protein